MNPRATISLTISFVLTIIETILLGISYFGGDINPARVAFGLVIASNTFFTLFALTTGERFSGPSRKKKASVRSDVLSDYLSKAVLIFLALGAVTGQVWALALSFWINVAISGLLLLVLLGAGIAVFAAVNKEAANS